MEYKCPCGKGFLRRKISNSEYNYKRPYYKCTTSEKANGLDCEFFAFEDELRMCTCGRGYCRNAKINGRKHWVCGIRDRDACEFRMLVTSSWSSSGSITPTLRSTQSQSQSIGSSSGGRRSNAAAALFEKFERIDLDGRNGEYHLDDCIHADPFEMTRL